MKRHSLSTMYGVGLVSVAPGTAGSLVAGLLAYGILQLPMGWAILTAGAVFFAVLGTAHASRYMRDRNTMHDPKEIVIDELVGQWLTYSVWFGLLFAMAGNQTAALSLLGAVSHHPLYLALGFILFRFFDILKPWPISYADKYIKGGFGVMFDDILAAIPAGVLLYIAYIFSPYLTGTLEVNP